MTSRAVATLTRLQTPAQRRARRCGCGVSRSSCARRAPRPVRARPRAPPWSPRRALAPAPLEPPQGWPLAQAPRGAGAVRASSASHRTLGQMGGPPPSPAPPPPSACHAADDGTSDPGASATLSRRELAAAPVDRCLSPNSRSPPGAGGSTEGGCSPTLSITHALHSLPSQGHPNSCHSTWDVVHPGTSKPRERPQTSCSTLDSHQPLLPNLQDHPQTHGWGPKVSLPIPKLWTTTP